ncbi:MAG TPA: acyl-CoA dehydrogenase [Burkholderiales bacterium]|nr:acyl-CoA dehydrogenase [Burkholderiales bacterium]
MNFDYNEEQQLLADSVRRYLAKAYDFEARKKIVAGEGWSSETWAQFAQMGLTGLPVSAEHDGFGGGAIDLMGVLEAFGEALVVEPYLPLVMAVRAIERGGAPELKARILPDVVEGKGRLAFAHAESGTRYSVDGVKTTARRDGSRWTLEGQKAAVIGAPIAQHLVVSARTPEGVGLFVVERAEVKPFRTMDERLAGDVTLRRVEAQPLKGDVALIAEVLDFATALACAEAVGAMQFACDTTLEYLKTRKQFGVPIGTFQALQHRMVEMFISLEQARSMACLAASRADAGGDPRAISAAKIKVSDAARHVSQEAVQLHGGMGMTEELKVSHAFRRLTVLAREFGDADHHLARFASL